MSQSGKSIIPSQSGNLRFEVDKNRIIMADDTDNRFIIDGSATPNPVIKITLPGRDVSSSNPLDFLLNSDDNLLRILDTFSVDYTSPDNTAGTTYGSDTVPIIHNLGYIPMGVIMYGASFVTTSLPDISDPLPLEEFALFSAGTVAGLDWLVTPTGSLDDRVIVSVLYPPGASPRRFNFKYFVLNETAG